MCEVQSFLFWKRKNKSERKGFTIRAAQERQLYNESVTEDLI